MAHYQPVSPPEGQYDSHSFDLDQSLNVGSVPYNPQRRRSRLSQITQADSDISLKTWKSIRHQGQTTTPLIVDLDELQRRNGWKPITMKAIVLVPFAIFSVLLAGAIEALAQYSERNGAIVRARSLQDISVGSQIAFLYLPTAIAVVYGLVWSWIELDIKRIHPWLELSKPSGVIAEVSMLEDYPYRFIATVPYRAFVRRHWDIVMTGIVTIILTAVFTPISTAFLGTSEVIITTDVAIENTAQLVPIDNQMVLLDSSILLSGYSTSWLSQPFPAFASPEFAILPFSVPEDSYRQSSEANITAPATQFWTDLECYPAQVTKKKDSASFDNGRGCVTEVGMTSKKYIMLYYGFHSSPQSSYFISSPKCDAKVIGQDNLFLAIWAEPFETTEENDETWQRGWNVKGHFCETKYYKQEVSIVMSESMRPYENSVTPISDPVPLAGSEFNSTSFEFVLGNGIGWVDLGQVEYPFTSYLKIRQSLQDPELESLIFKPFTEMISFVFAGRNLTLDEWGEGDNYVNALEAAHKSLFSIAMTGITQNSTSSTGGTAKVSARLFGIVASRRLAIVAEVSVLLVAVLSIYIWTLCSRAPSMLQRDPASIGQVFEIFRRSKSLIREFKDFDTFSEEELINAIKGRRYRLVSDDAGSHGSNGYLTIVRVDSHGDDDDGDDEISTPALGRTTTDNASVVLNGQYTPSRPVMLKKRFGTFAILVLIGIFVTLLYFRITEQRLRGLPLPTKNEDMLNLLIGYIPTAMATLVEPVLVLLNRYLCILQPYRSLYRGNSPSSESLDLRYTSIPPQMSILRAIQAKHVILVLLCSVTILSNVLAVALSGFFNQGTAQSMVPIRMQAGISPTLNESLTNIDGFWSSEMYRAADDYQFHFFAAASNITNGYNLPPWVTPKFFFQPQSILGGGDIDDGLEDDQNSTKGSAMGMDNDSNNGSKNRADLLRLRTRGYGVDVACKPAVTVDEAPFLNIMGDPAQASDSVQCENPANKTTFHKSTSDYQVTEGNVAIEQLFSLRANYSLSDSCSQLFVMGYGRTRDMAGFYPDKEVTTSFLVCKVDFVTAPFEVTVDRGGYIRDYRQMEELTSDLGYPDSEAQTNAMLTATTEKADSGYRGRWHNHTMSSDWFHYLVRLRTGNNTVLDPKEPLPTVETVGPVIEDIYQRLFAILWGINMRVFPAPSPEQIARQEAEAMGAAGPSTSLPAEGAVRIIRETRIFVSGPAFWVSVVILPLTIAVVILFYLRGAVYLLPRLPTAIGSLLGFVAPSRMLAGWPEGGLGPEEKKMSTFTFGRYDGMDSRPHIGIEMDPWVVKLDRRELAKG